jgi:DNA-directed RNA polymerase specialized sigma24 family protein
MDLDRQLQQLALEVKQYQPKTRERQLGLTKLFYEIQSSGRLYRPCRGELLPHVYEDIYNEAKQELWLFIAKNIDDYDPQKGEVMAWVNNRFYWKFRSLVIAWTTRQNTHKTLDDYEHTQPEKNSSLIEQLRKIVGADPEGIFENNFPENYPNANFKVLLMARLSGKSWINIEEELGIKSTTIRSFYHRRLTRLRDTFLKYLEEIDEIE